MWTSRRLPITEVDTQAEASDADKPEASDNRGGRTGRGLRCGQAGGFR